MGTSHFEVDKTIRFLKNARIVDVVIVYLLLHPDDVQAVMRGRALSLFERPESAGERCSGDFFVDGILDRDEFFGEIKTSRRCNILVMFAVCEATFGMAAGLMNCTREESGIAMYGGCSEVFASNYTRVVCEASLQIVSE
ncbi:unnamed protein product [Agarophyton chilense]